MPGPFIATAIEAVQAQTIDGWELVIVDDCSTDSTLAIARSYAASDTRIRCSGGRLRRGSLCAAHGGDRDMPAARL